MIAVQCPDGDAATGGGVSSGSANGSFPIDADYNTATDGETPTGWATNGDPNGGDVTVYAICVPVATPSPTFTPT
jgi:hypothetical protein